MKRRKTKLIIIPDEGFTEYKHMVPYCNKDYDAISGIDEEHIDKKDTLVNNVKKLRRNNVLSFGGKKQ